MLQNLSFVIQELTALEAPIEAFALYPTEELEFIFMSPEEKRARRRERDRAAYARDPDAYSSDREH